MAEVTAVMVQELREATNLPMMECKRALTEANGDKEKAIRILRERGLAIAQKKATRVANQGLIASALKGRKAGSLIEVNCETDFVARNNSFVEFVNGLAARACDTDSSLADTCKSDLTAKVAEIGENLVIRRNARFTLKGNGTIASYIHPGGRIGVLLEIGCQNEGTLSSSLFDETVKDVAMHVAACSPACLDEKSVPADTLKAEREIYAKQVQNKPANIVEKIVDGKIKKFYTQICLVQQPFVKDPAMSVTEYLNARGTELKDTLTIRRYLRYELGR